MTLGENMGLVGTLVNLEDEAESSFVYEHLNMDVLTVRFDGGPLIGPWLGFRDALNSVTLPGQEGIWRSMATGQEVAFTNFAPTELVPPFTGPTEHCAFMLSGALWARDKWGDAPCNDPAYRLGFICQFTRPKPIDPSGLCPSELQADAGIVPQLPEGGSPQCVAGFSFLRRRRTWQEVRCAGAARSPSARRTAHTWSAYPLSSP